MPDPSPLTIAGQTFQSRLLLGTAGYPNQSILLKALAASTTELVTVAIRRMDLSSDEGSLADLLRPRYRLLPNTAGCYTAADAVLTAELSREALETNWIKLEVIGDKDTLYPDVVELLSAARTLVQRGFVVLAYTSDDPITAQRLADAGVAAVMPLAAPIGSGAGLLNPYALKLIRRVLPDMPLLVDAGIGTASEAAAAMELGYDGVLLNTAVSKALDPVMMADAMGKAVAAGRLAYLAGRIPVRETALPSTPGAPVFNV
ncbi:MAG: thiazole synthase [Holosporales bacterium]|jgi:thiazole synthase